MRAASRALHSCSPPPKGTVTGRAVRIHDLDLADEYRDVRVGLREDAPERLLEIAPLE